MKTELTPAMEKRLARLAKAAGRTPAEMLPHVMRDGFAYNETFVRKVNEAIQQADAGNLIPHEQVMRQVQATITKAFEKAGKRKRSAPN